MQTIYPSHHSLPPLAAVAERVGASTLSCMAAGRAWAVSQPMAGEGPSQEVHSWAEEAAVGALRRALVRSLAVWWRLAVEAQQ